MTTVYAGLEKNALFTQDRKIPFQWIQAGSTGNTPGQGNKPHGTSVWTPGANGTLVGCDPKPNWDDFIFYSTLPFPVQSPKRMRATAGNWAASSPAAWASAQQMEGPQLEYIFNGFKYTFCWAVNPVAGLQFWSGHDAWKPLATGKAINSLATPTFWVAEFTLDIARHTCRYEFVVVGSEMIAVGIEVPAVATPIARKELSVAVQLDGNKPGDAYSALLNNLVAEWG